MWPTWTTFVLNLRRKWKFPLFIVSRIHTMAFGVKTVKKTILSIPLQENLTGCLWTSLPCNHKMAYKNKLLDGSQEWITKLKRGLKSCYWFSYFTEQNGNQRCIEQQEKKANCGKCIMISKMSRHKIKNNRQQRPLFDKQCLSGRGTTVYTQPNCRRSSINLLNCIENKIACWM